MALEMNLLRAVILLINFCTSFIIFGEVISNMPCTFSGLASISRCDTMNPRNFPNETSGLALWSLVLFDLI